MREPLALVCAILASLAIVRCAAAPAPQPVMVVIGDADIPLAQLVCANLVAFCPSSVPDGGEPVCEAVVTARYGLTPLTQPTVLTCEAFATDKASFKACQGVSSCP